MSNNTTLKYRVSQLEKTVDKIENNIEITRTERLPKIESRIISMKTRVNVLTGVNIGAIVLLAIINRYL